MKHFSALCFSLLLSFLPLKPTAASGFELQSVSTPLLFQVIDNLIVVRANVDGSEGFFLLDTGAANLILNRRHFSRYMADYRGQYQTLFNSSQDCWAVRIRRFKWGALQRSNFLVAIEDLSLVEQKLGLTILGLIGYQVFRKLEIHFDPHKGILTLIALDRQGRPKIPYPGPAPNEIIPFKLGEHLPLVRAHTASGRRLWLGVDSGATINVLDQSWKRALRSLLTPAGMITIGDAGANLQTAECVTMSHINLEGCNRREEFRATFLNLEHLRPGGYRLDGLINLETLLRSRVSINYRLREIYLWNS